MSKLKLSTNPKVKTLFDSCEEPVKTKLLNLRELIIEIAESIPEISSLEETLKWGEPSYLTKIGSTIRINSKKNLPGKYAMYFQCTSKLIPTFKIFYKDLFTFEGNRAILFDINEEIPIIELSKCIACGLKYHKVKNLPILGL